MKLVSYQEEHSDRLGILVDGLVYALQDLDSELPRSISSFLERWDHCFDKALRAEEKMKNGQVDPGKGMNPSSLQLLAPVPFPSSCRDGYAFRQHVESARRNRGVPMIPEFDQYPVFYFTNHHSIVGPGPVRCMPDHFDELDFELELAIVINRRGRNIPAAEAESYIAGFMIMNDISARRLQMEEMLLNLGPAKGKDFATATGPWLVTPDELEQYAQPGPGGHTGRNWNLNMVCRVNGVEWSRGNAADMNWTFAELIERASYGTELYPGDIIGSGTVGTGCFLELNGTGKLKDPSWQEQWLRENDETELEIDGLGVLRNKFVREESALSLFALRKSFQADTK